MKIKRQEDISMAEVVGVNSFWREVQASYWICFRKGSSHCLLKGIEACFRETGNGLRRGKGNARIKI